MKGLRLPEKKGIKRARLPQEKGAGQAHGKQHRDDFRPARPVEATQCPESEAPQLIVGGGVDKRTDDGGWQSRSRPGR